MDDGAVGKIQFSHLSTNLAMVNSPWLSAGEDGLYETDANKVATSLQDSCLRTPGCLSRDHTSRAVAVRTALLLRKAKRKQHENERRPPKSENSRPKKTPCVVGKIRACCQKERRAHPELFRETRLLLSSQREGVRIMQASNGKHRQINIGRSRHPHAMLASHQFSLVSPPAPPPPPFAH